MVLVDSGARVVAAVAVAARVVLAEPAAVRALRLAAMDRMSCPALIACSSSSV